jgi:hypothetical protein
MSNEQRQGLQRIRINDQLPAGFEQLPPEEQKKLREKYVTDQLEARNIAMRGAAQSAIGENDLTVGLQTVQNLDADRKVYSFEQRAQMGSGEAKLKIKGGDTRFIVPILIAIGVIIVALIALFSR